MYINQVDSIHSISSSQRSWWTQGFYQNPTGWTSTGYGIAEAIRWEKLNTFAIGEKLPHQPLQHEESFA